LVQQGGFEPPTPSSTN